MDRITIDILDPQLTSLVEHSSVPAGIGKAVRNPAGARFYRCALQVNPFAYTRRAGRTRAWSRTRSVKARLLRYWFAPLFHPLSTI
jgi:hypothetical protein